MDNEVLKGAKSLLWADFKMAAWYHVTLHVWRTFSEGSTGIFKPIVKDLSLDMNC